MAGEPLVRARHLKSLLGFADGRPDGLGARLRERVAPATVKAIADASGIDWLPFAFDLELTRALHALLGEPEFARFFRAHTLSSFEGPLLKTLVETGRRMFGLDPTSFARWVPKGWSLLFRECGTWSVTERAPGRVELRVVGFPGTCVRDPIWIDSVASALGALLDLSRLSGTVTGTVDQSAVVYAMTWRA